MKTSAIYTEEYSQINYIQQLYNEYSAGVFVSFFPFINDADLQTDMKTFPKWTVK